MDILFWIAIVFGVLAGIVFISLAAAILTIMIGPPEHLDYTFEDDEI